MELDRDGVLQQALDRMLASLDEPGNEALLKWLTDYSLEQIRAGEKWDVSRKLLEFSKLFLQDSFKLKRRKFGPELWDKDTIRHFREKLQEIIDGGKDSDPDVKTARVLDKQVHLLGIVSDLYAHLDAVLKEHNLVLLSETTDVLSRIIDGSDTPFIYEKVGTRFDHFMLDEFQDTSRLQWENFRPLLHEGVDKGLGSLIVGDIKQSIYRWRDSDMNLLHSEVEADFHPGAFHVTHKQHNWRSEEQIVNFNNSFFEEIGNLLGAQKVPFAGRIAGYYADVHQEVAKPEQLGKGYVRAQFLPRGGKGEPTWREVALESIEDLMADLIKRYSASDIAFLVRKNDEGTLVARKLLSLGYPVVTEDSLTIASCPSVRRLAALLKYRVNPEDSVNAALMRQLFGEIPPLSESCRVSDSLYDICVNLLRECLPDIPDGDTPFIYAFLDEVLAYTDRYGSNLCGFVSWWDESGNKITVNSARRADAVTVTTIHKAKGLDFQVVVVPFFNEAFSHPNQSTILWCTPKAAPFDTIGLVPVPGTKKDLVGTHFQDDLEEETEMSFVDTINTMYVAMTRAVKEMYLFAPVPVFKKDSGISGQYFAVSDLLYNHLLPDGLLKGTPFVHEEGTKEAPETEDEKHAPELAPLRYASLPYEGRLRLSLKGGDFFSREEGIRYHDILSRIDVADDLPGAVQEAVREGLLRADEAPEAEARIAALLEQVKDRHWFDGTYRALNEIAIVDAKGKIHRPDRVLVEKDKPLGQGKAFVIDYKFGRREEEQYRSQIGRYMTLLTQMGYRDVRGTLWYCNEQAEDVQ